MNEMKMEKEVKEQMKRLGLSQEKQLVSLLSNITVFLAKRLEDSNVDVVMMMKLSTYNEMSIKSNGKFKETINEFKERLMKNEIELRLYLTESDNFAKIKDIIKSDIIKSIDKL